MNRKIKISVIAPCYNEQDNIRALSLRLIKVFKKLKVSGEVILVNDASSDQTAEIAESLSKKHASISVIHHVTNQGLFAGWQSGVKAAQGQYICFIDADLQNPPEELSRLFRELRDSKFDLVQGVRSSIGRLKDSRYLLSVVLNYLLNLTFGMKATDNKSGFIIGSADVMRDVINYRYEYFYPHTFVHVAAHSKEYQVKEVETLFESRQSGSSFIKSFPVRTIYQVLLDLPKSFLEFRILNSRESDLKRFLRDNPPAKKPEPYKGWRKALFEAYFFTCPLHKWMITRRVRKDVLDLRESQFLSKAKIESFQLQRLKKLIRHAYRHVPYYRNKLKELDLKPEDFKSLEDLQKFPLLSKSDVRENIYFDMFADNHVKSEMSKISTSGSTGEPFVCYADRRQLEIRFASTFRSTEWTGWRFGDRQTRLWHQTIGMSFLQVLREKLDALFMRRKFIPAYEIGEDNLEEFIDEIRSHKPALIDGYAESFNFIARYLKKNKIKDLSPKAIMSSAQVMPDHIRQIIEEGFDCQVFDKYGSREFSGIAYEDQGHDGHIIQAESYIVEILKSGRPAMPGEIGEIVITDLNNYHMPMIRYRIGDLATALDSSQPSKSGSEFPRIGRIEGRSQALVYCNNKKYLPGTFFAHFFKEFDQKIKQYQVVQEDTDNLIIKIVPDLVYNREVEATVVRELGKFTGPRMNLRVELVEQIPMGRTGKRKSVVSKLKLDFLELDLDD